MSHEPEPTLSSPSPPPPSPQRHDFPTHGRGSTTSPPRQPPEPTTSNTPRPTLPPSKYQYFLTVMAATPSLSASGLHRRRYPFSWTPIVGCKDPKCRWISPNVQCDGCRKNTTGCKKSCPLFRANYGSGSTTALLISETLIFPEKSVENFIVGCSIFASTEPSGIAGFGRAPDSLPAQMGLKRFSYCLVSHEFDDEPVHSNLVLETASGAGASTEGARINYTPFSKNPTTPKHPAYKEYYYVTLQKITVGGVDVRVPFKFLVADAEGRGGTIVDSGTTLTFMENQVYELVAGELEKQVGKNYSRAAEVENLSGLGPCFKVSDENSFTVPELAFHFKGGAKMALPVENYFSPLVDSAMCMTITTDRGGGGGGVGKGPAIIFGNYQQQNIYMEYDLENERLGFRKQVCNNK
ncbi:UNVERIFIED_CONTAM: Aspartic proteinase nepenthesin-2 [Sesamum angustifolium]|uniref:Aspartic proteinase nepenthesin-2 n=1 Tax=Sesamum angustifolium TaxID=2727405 RepID=A0AAW2MRR8_9LAMI